MKKVFLIIASCCFFAACNDTSNKPEHFIQEAQMEDILYDVAVLYGIQNNIVSRNDSIKPVNMKSIFEKYDIDSIIFVDNNRYYVGLDKNVYFNMQTRIVKRLENNRAIIDSLVGKKGGNEELVKLERVKVELDTVQIEKLPLESSIDVSN